MTGASQSEFTVEWLENAIGLVSFCIVQDGAVYAPVLDRLEAELAALKQHDDVIARARRHLAQREISSFA